MKIPTPARTLALVLLVAIFAFTGCATARVPTSCSLPEQDRLWVDRALDAWRFTSREITGIHDIPRFEAILFSADCVLRSDNALTSATTRGVRWTASPHAGTIALPDGSEVEAGVTSYVSGKEDHRYLVMSTPSVWEAAGVGKGDDLRGLMIAVLLHEGSHVAQIGPYGPRLGALIERHALPDSFNDNAVQERFGKDAEFAASVQEETRLFLAAAAASDDQEAKSFAREARRLMRARQARWFVGGDAYLAEAEDIWLTFEGAGQWTGFRWRTHPQGGAQPEADALARFTRGRQWSQTEGFALVLALDRLAGPGWKRHAFGDGAKTVLEMLDEALGADAST